MQKYKNQPEQCHFCFKDQNRKLGMISPFWMRNTWGSIHMDRTEIYSVGKLDMLYIETIWTHLKDHSNAPYQDERTLGTNKEQ